MELAVSNPDVQKKVPQFGGPHFAYAVEDGRYTELRGASASELARFKQKHPGAICREDGSRTI